ncbi:Zinc finger protein 410 [Amphibalanus amphitrite]|uniref:Zinc finger protein 410 n=1 Tax=Amphibalanus amphitrite TaxID=1232801 RepID=A0A6A4VHF8_AMPAM|nr:Zinc finger protein 410 [Amphibalanus amphitrite]
MFSTSAVQPLAFPSDGASVADRSPFGSEVLLPGTGQGLRRRPHGVDTPFGCPHCPAAYSNRGSLVNHMSIHSGRTVCEACGKVFSTVSSRNRHINKHHQEAEPAGGEQPPPAPLPGTVLPTMASVSGMALQTMAARQTSPVLFPQLPRTTSLVRLPLPPHPLPPPAPAPAAQQAEGTQAPSDEFE